MKFVADENVDRAIVDLLREEGHEVSYVAEAASGLGDRDVLRLAEESGAVLITFDKDFGELVFNQRLVTRGVVLLRLAGLKASRKVDLVRSLMAEHAGELMESFTVLDENSVRIRRRLSTDGS